MEITKILSQSFLFQGINEDMLSWIIEGSPPTVISFKRGDLVYSSSKLRSVGFILSGIYEIRLDKSDGTKTVLNILEQSDSFGILSVYSSDEFPTQVYATKNSEIMFFTDEQIKVFVNNYSHISSNLIAFLANRISFLNKKIATFSGSRVEARLAAFLLTERAKYHSDSFPFNAKKTSEKINVGRASVYRGIDALEELSLIELVDKKIYIKDLIGLERITK